MPLVLTFYQKSASNDYKGKWITCTMYSLEENNMNLARTKHAKQWSVVLVGFWVLSCLNLDNINSLTDREINKRHTTLKGLVPDC